MSHGYGAGGTWGKALGQILGEKPARPLPKTRIFVAWLKPWLFFCSVWAGSLLPLTLLPRIRNAGGSETLRGWNRNE